MMFSNAESVLENLAVKFDLLKEQHKWLSIIAV